MTDSPSFRPLRTDVRSAIRDRIVVGDYAPGERLVERRIAAELDVSRVPVREALHGLVREGFAVDRATRGIAVRSYDAAEIAELAQVGAALESVLVCRLAETGPGDHLDRLADVLAVAGRAVADDDQPSAVQANAEFHAALEALAADTIVGEVLDTVGARRRWLLRQHADPAAIHAEHVQLYEAITSGNPELAVRIIGEHAATSISHAVAMAERDAHLEGVQSEGDQ